MMPRGIIPAIFNHEEGSDGQHFNPKRSCHAQTFDLA